MTTEDYSRRQSLRRTALAEQQKPHPLAQAEAFAEGSNRNTAAREGALVMSIPVGAHSGESSTDLLQPAKTRTNDSTLQQATTWNSYDSVGGQSRPYNIEITPSDSYSYNNMD